MNWLCKLPCHDAPPMAPPLPISWLVTRLRRRLCGPLPCMLSKHVYAALCHDLHTFFFFFASSTSLCETEFQAIKSMEINRKVKEAGKVRLPPCSALLRDRGEGFSLHSWAQECEIKHTQTHKCNVRIHTGSCAHLYTRIEMGAGPKLLFKGKSWRQWATWPTWKPNPPSALCAHKVAQLAIRTCHLCLPAKGSASNP